MTLNQQPFRHLIAHRDKVSAREYNRLVDLASKMAHSLMTNGIADSSGFSIRKQISSEAIEYKVFQVVSAATGDGNYTCNEQTLDASVWNTTSGDDRFHTKDAVEVEVFNLMENDSAADHTPMLALYDRIRAWQWVDDLGETRWVGIPLVNSNRRVKATEAAGAAPNITCNLILNDGSEATGEQLGAGIEVYGDVCGGTDLNDAIPRIADDDELAAYWANGVWYFTTTFQASEVCDCYTV